ncbi:hypothetical protein ['Camptotheca acuminata' phytoplasma]|uniref:hypothetical protein n=1 Tax='Camptotheca acuminata' phytoplasma TaxID=3239192 RepID=UPI00351A2343
MINKITNYIQKTNEINELFLIYTKENKNNNKIREQIFLLFYENIIFDIVYKIKYYPRILEKKDLLNEGILVMDYILINYSLEKYKCDFVTYAKGKIKQQIDNLIRISHCPSIPTRDYNQNKKEKKRHQNATSLSSQESIQNYDSEHMNFFTKYLNPHQIYMKQIYHELFLNRMKKKLSLVEYKVLKYIYGIPSDNVHNNYQPIFTFDQITSKLNITKQQIYKYKDNALIKLKNKF